MLLILCIFIHPIRLPQLCLLVDVLHALWSLLLRNMMRYSRNDNIWHYLHIHERAGLVLCQGHVPEKITLIKQNSHLKQCVSGGLGDWKPNPV